MVVGDSSRFDSGLCDVGGTGVETSFSNWSKLLVCSVFWFCEGTIGRRFAGNWMGPG